jgi:hypothetical protein
MLHTTYTQGNRSNSQLSMAKSQIGNLTPDLSFGHNLCLKCLDGSREPILDIYIPRAFQWYKNSSIQWVMTLEIFLWRFKSPSRLQLPKWELIWECEGSFPHTLLHSWEHEMWLLGFLLACTLTNPCLCHKPKARVTTSNMYSNLVKSSYGWSLITNLTCDKLIMKIMQSSYIHRFVHFMHEYYVLNIRLTRINVLMDEIQTYEWTNVTKISHPPINLCFKYVFNARYLCVKCTNYEWTNFARFPLLNCEMLNCDGHHFSYITKLEKKTLKKRSRKETWWWQVTQ